MNKNYDIVINELNNKFIKAVKLMYNKHYNMVLWGMCDNYETKRHDEFLNHIFRANCGIVTYMNHPVFSSGREKMPLKFYQALLFL